MNDVALDPTGDIYAATRGIEGDAYVAQKIQIRLNLFQGEWIQDVARGMPWFRWIQTKPFPLNEVRDILRNEIEGVEEVDRLERITTSYSNETGEYSFSADIVTFGEDARRLDIATNFTSFNTRTTLNNFPGSHYFLFSASIT